MLVISGLLNKQVGGELGICENTVKFHRAQAIQKMKADSLADLVRMAARLGLTGAKKLAQQFSAIEAGRPHFRRIRSAHSRSVRYLPERGDRALCAVLLATLALSMIVVVGVKSLLNLSVFRAAYGLFYWLMVSIR